MWDQLGLKDEGAGAPARAREQANASRGPRSSTGCRFDLHGRALRGLETAQLRSRLTACAAAASTASSLRTIRSGRFGVTRDRHGKCRPDAETRRRLRKVPIRRRHSLPGRDRRNSTGRGSEEAVSNGSSDRRGLGVRCIRAGKHLERGRPTEGSQRAAEMLRLPLGGERRKRRVVPPAGPGRARSASVDRARSAPAPRPAPSPRTPDHSACR